MMTTGGGFQEVGHPCGNGTANGAGVYSLKWNSFQTHITKGLSKLLENNSYTDVTLACEGEFLQAHKLLLSLCSPFFKRLFEVNSNGGPTKNTIVILNHVRFKDLESIIRFIYNGQTNVSQVDLNNFLETGELLQIEGLASCSQTQNTQPPQNSGSAQAQNSSGTGTVQLPPLPMLHSHPRMQNTMSTSPTTSSATVTTSTSSPLDSRLRASLTNSVPVSASFPTLTQIHNIVVQPANAVQPQINPHKRPRLTNSGQDMPMPTTSRPNSQLQSILTGQGYSNSSSDGDPSNSVLNAGRSTSSEPEIVILERDPLEQDDDVVHIEETHKIECEPFIDMGSVTHEQIQVYPLEDQKEDDITISDDDHEDDFEESQVSDTGVYQGIGATQRRQAGPSSSHQARPTGVDTGIRLSQEDSACSQNIFGFTSTTRTSTNSEVFDEISAVARSSGSRSRSIHYGSTSNIELINQSSPDETLNEIEMSPCHICHQVFFTKDLDDHMYKNHGQGSELCPFCNRYFKNKNSLKVHKSTKHRKPRIPFVVECLQTLTTAIHPTENTAFDSLINYPKIPIAQIHELENKPVAQPN